MKKKVKEENKSEMERKTVDTLVTAPSQRKRREKCEKK